MKGGAVCKVHFAGNRKISPDMDPEPSFLYPLTLEYDGVQVALFQF